MHDWFSDYDVGLVVVTVYTGPTQSDLNIAHRTQITKFSNVINNDYK